MIIKMQQNRYMVNIRYVFVIWLFWSHVLFVTHYLLKYQIQGQLEQEYAAYCFKNIEESEKMCRRVIDNLYRPIDDAIQSGQYASAGGYTKYSKAMKNLEAEYRKTKGKGSQVT